MHLTCIFKKTHEKHDYLLSNNFLLFSYEIQDASIGTKIILMSDAILW